MVTMVCYAQNNDMYVLNNSKNTIISIVSLVSVHVVGSCTVYVCCVGGSATSEDRDSSHAGLVSSTHL